MTPKNSLEQPPILEESEVRTQLKEAAVKANELVINLQNQVFALIGENKIEEARELRTGKLAEAREESSKTLDAWLDDIKK